MRDPWKWLVFLLIVVVLAIAAAMFFGGNWQSYGSLPAAFAALVGAGSASMFALILWNFNERSLRRQARQDHIRMLLDADRLLIEKPELWAIYPGRSTVPSATEPTRDGSTTKSANTVQGRSDAELRREAFIYYHLNMYEAVYDFYESLRERRFLGLTARDEEYYGAWNSHMGFVAGGEEVKRVVAAATEAKEFAAPFLEHFRQQGPS
jgi:hypothetical protein